MPMSFELSTSTVLWFPSWRTDGPASYTLALALVICLGLAHEALAARRWAAAAAAAAPGAGAGAAASSSSDDGGGADAPLLLASDGAAAAAARQQQQQQQQQRGGGGGGGGGGGSAASLSPATAARRRQRDRALAYALSLVTSYLLMLAVMTYNVGVFVAVVSGMALGHYLFSTGGGQGGGVNGGLRLSASRARLLHPDPCCAF
jgi:hypothetical protein